MDTLLKIKQLSEATINKIAAGEVIEKPASVVKELIENAIDAEATKIYISLEDAGKNLIKVSDNGYGMLKEDLELSIKRHTTSKLNEADITNIRSFGFRGEAIPSIAAISRLRIITKTVHQEHGYELKTVGGALPSIIEAYCNTGTSVEVRDLFFSTPARLKFLKSDKGELYSSIAVIKKIAISNPHVEFILEHNNKSILHYKKCELNERIYQILGEELRENAISVDFQHEELRIHGLVGIPTFNKAAADSQFLIVNNRPIKDKMLATALKAAYMDVLPNNRFAVAAIFIELDPLEIDVNVHPAKAEIRFRQENFIRGTLIDCLKKALRMHGNKSIESSVLDYFIEPIIPDSSLNERPHGFDNSTILKKASSRNDDEHTSMIQQSFVEIFNQSPQVSRGALESGINTLSDSAVSRFVDKGEETADAITQYKSSNLGAAISQFHENYIISQVEDGILIIDQHAAHERIVYEQIKLDFANKTLIKHQLLLPEIIKIIDHHRFDVLSNAIPDLLSLGIEVSQQKEYFVIKSLPSILIGTEIKKLINDIIDELIVLENTTSFDEKVEHILETMACHQSIRKGRLLSIKEMNELLRQMERTPFSGQCNHGRPTYIKLKLKDIEKLFGRK